MPLEPNYIDDIKLSIGKNDAIVMDYNGVIFNPKDNSKYHAADVLIKEAKTKKIPLYILSNSTASAMGFEKNMEKMGYIKGTDYIEVLTAGEAFKLSLISKNSFLEEKGIQFSNRKIYSIGHVFPQILENTNFTLTNNPNEADFAYLGIPQISSEEYENLNSEDKKGFSPSNIVLGNYDVLATSKKAANLFYKTKVKKISLPIVNANQDKTAGEVTPKGDNVLLYRQGYFAELHEKNAGKVIKLGKPYPEIMKIAIDKIKQDLNISKPKVIFFGDNLYTDIKGVENLKQDKETKSFKLSSVLCLNGYWQENDRKVAKLLEFIEQQNKQKKLSEHINKISHKEKAYPNIILNWTMK